MFTYESGDDGEKQSQLSVASVEDGEQNDWDGKQNDWDENCDEQFSAMSRTTGMRIEEDENCDENEDYHYDDENWDYADDNYDKDDNYTPDGRKLALKLRRLGRVSFKSITRNRDYLQHRKHASWM